VVKPHNLSFNTKNVDIHPRNCSRLMQLANAVRDGGVTHPRCFGSFDRARGCIVQRGVILTTACSGGLTDRRSQLQNCSQTGSTDRLTKDCVRDQGRTILRDYRSLWVAGCHGQGSCESLAAASEAGVPIAPN
jgi:hypothetical protein